MPLFLLLTNYISTLVAVQLLRGDLSNDDTMNFGQIYDSFQDSNVRGPWQ